MRSHLDRMGDRLRVAPSDRCLPDSPVCSGQLAQVKEAIASVLAPTKLSYKHLTRESYTLPYPVAHGSSRVAVGWQMMSDRNGRSAESSSRNALVPR
jgi:hypothetical protein